jgi:LPS sulfotransferase NodH
VGDPVIVVSAPRSGSTLLFEQLSSRPGIWTIGGESHGVFRAFPHLQAENAQLDSGCLLASHADEDTVDAFRRCMAFLLRNHNGEPWIAMRPEDRPSNVTLLEKTPRNALNVPFLLQVFPGARFIYLYRDARATIASLVEAWQIGLKTGRFVTFRDLPGWDRAAWCFLLPRGWRNLTGKTLFDIAAFQWAACNDKLLDDLEMIDDGRCTAVAYEELTAAPSGTLQRLAEFANVDDRGSFAGSRPLSLSRTTLSPPHPNKWRRWEQEIEALETVFAASEQRAHRVVQRWGT